MCLSFLIIQLYKEFHPSNGKKEMKSFLLSKQVKKMVSSSNSSDSDKHVY